VRTAKRTLGSDRLGWHRFYGRRDVFSTAFALDHDALPAFRSGEHRDSIGEYKAKVIHNPYAWKLVDFHAYRGYGYTHKRGIEADHTRITGVSTTHNLGRFLPQFLTLLRLTPSPVSLYDSYNYYPLVADGQRWNSTSGGKRPFEYHRIREPPPHDGER
jgi:hypothetical protein